MATRPKRNEAKATSKREEPEPAVRPVEPRDASCLVVGIGSSAGGLEAVSQLFAHLPTDTGLAYVVVQHLDPHHPTALPELLQKVSKMPVVEVRDGDRVQSNYVYTIAPNSQIRISHGHLRVVLRPEGREGHFPVDAFFISLAMYARDNAIGVILSGNATDGTAGLRAIKAEGGTTFGQIGARFDGMPQSAMDAGVVDRFLTPAQIAHALVEFGRPGPSHLLDQQESVLIEQILQAVREETGVDFSQYKQPTIQRRLFRRMATQEAPNLAAYLARLQGDTAERRALGEDFLINATGFFRDPAVFERLKETVLP